MMNPIVLPVSAIILGLIVLTWGTDKFLGAASAIAKRFGVSTFLIGLTIVAFGTSTPEMVVSIFASLDGSAGLAIGNVLGSNVANIGLVLGLAALVSPIPFKPVVLKQELPFYMVVVFAVGALLFDGNLTLTDGITLIVLLLTFICLLVYWENVDEDGIEGINDTPSLTPHFIWFVVGLALLLGSSKILVWGAVEIATLWGVSETIIGLTIVAIGTSLPELATTIGSALKKQHGLAFGNILGSNILNLLCVLPIPAILAPGLLPEGIWPRDYLWMAGISLIFALFAFFNKTVIVRFAGLILLSIYLSYNAYLGYSAMV